MTRKVLLSLMLWMMGVTVAFAGDFNHQAHLDDYAAELACDACHLADAPSIVPETKVCLECHSSSMIDGLTLAPTKTHGPAWALNHRAEARSRASDCGVCHAQEYCLECHKSGFADEMGEVGNNMINVHRDDFMVSHPIPARTDQHLCSSCHESRFCSDCHDAWRFKASDIGSPSHRRTFQLGYDDADFNAIHAPLSNNGNVSAASLMCDSCHLQSSVAPSFHDWSVGHAREARKSLMTCQACHPEGDACLKCHSARNGASAFNPHPKDWGDFKNRLNRASNGRTCRKCHN